MSILEAVILGIVQGITEFLPISSTAHLTLTGKIMGLIHAEHSDQWTAFIAVIQLGTLLSIVVYFWKDIVNIVKAFLRENIAERKPFKQQGFDSRMGWMVIIGTIPVGVIGLALKKVIEGDLTKNLYVIAGTLILLAVVLAIAEKTAKFKRSLPEVTIKDALIVGFAQSLALIPGASRSGTTLTGGLFLGLTRESAARFSFLLSIPAILLSGLLQFYQALSFLKPEDYTTLAVATFFSAVSGYAAIDFLLKFLKRYSTYLFIIYRIVLGLLIFGLLFYKIIEPI